MKILLSHTKTKIVQADYQAQKTIDLSWQNVRRVVVVGGQNTWEQENIFLPPKQPWGQPRGNRQGDCLTYRRWCHSQSYDILLTQKFSSWFPGIIQVFAKATFLVTGSGKNHRTTLSAFSEAENTGCFSERGKLHAGKLSWKLKSSMVFLSLDRGADVIPRVQIMPLIMKFVCQPNLPKTNMCSETELRWLLSKNKQAQSEWLPPT